MSYEPFTSRPPAASGASRTSAMTPGQSPPQIGQESLRSAPACCARSRRDLAEAHEVIGRLMSQRPTAGICACPMGRFDAEGVCTNADCEHRVERHESGRCDVAVVG